MTLFTRLKRKCEETGTNFKKIEQELGFGNGTLRKWEHQNPSYDKVIAVAKSLNVSFAWLATGKEEAELSPEEQLLIEYYRNSSSTGRRSTLGTAKMNSELMPAEQQSSTSPNGLTGTGDV